MSATATLTGTRRRPLLRLSFDRADRCPDGTLLLDLVRGLPGRAWDPVTSTWTVTATGHGPDALFAHAGITVDLITGTTGTDLAGTRRLDELVDPLARRSVADPAMVLVRPRLVGYAEAARRLGPAATWDPTRERFTIPLTELVEGGRPRRGVVMEVDLVRAAIDASDRAARPSVPERVRHGAARLAAATGTEAEALAALRGLEADVGGVPNWFGLDLYPYQRAGAIAAAAGHRAICDEPGLGKTRALLAAVAVRDPDRVVIVCPPVVTTHWQRESAQSGVATHGPILGARTAGPATTGAVVVVRAGRREPALPHRGVVIVPDSVLAARPDLLDRLIGWAPQALVYDEAHRAKTWAAARTQAVLTLARAVRGPRFAATGTPMFDNPAEMAPQLAITGHLDPVFGGHTAFVARYARQNPWGGWEARKARLPELKEKLDAHVWVRRTKSQVLADLPPKSRRAEYVDVDLTAFRATHRDVITAVERWVDQMLAATGTLPTPGEVDAFCSAQVRHVSRLRLAAGLAKIPAALDLIADHVRSSTARDPDGHPAYSRPLIVWGHHHEVFTALLDGLSGVVDGVESIHGGTPDAERDRIVEAFQAAQVPVLVASIHKAGVGLTLTAGQDSLFVETDFTPALVSQAEDRQHRVGQTRPVFATTLIAPGTLDESIQAILTRKADVLDAVLTGGDNHVAVTTHADDLAGPGDILRTMVEDAIAARRTRAASRRRRAA